VLRYHTNTGENYHYWSLTSLALLFIYVFKQRPNRSNSYFGKA